ncbi:MAG TPA: MerR family DNA-binding transcriptional regulator, partial [Spirochaetota bacterium]|nr:MerR family DNA-binding transcriptional regulator [Spirochaetota bacterium]
MRRRKPHLFGIKEASARSGIHPSTIRLYEKIGAIPLISRSPNNYRVFTETNVLQIKIAWQAFRFTWLSGPIRRAGLDVITHSVAADFPSAMISAERLDSLIDDEIREAKSAIRAVKRWVTCVPPVRTPHMLQV